MHAYTIAEPNAPLDQGKGECCACRRSALKPAVTKDSWGGIHMCTAGGLLPQKQDALMQQFSILKNAHSLL